MVGLRQLCQRNFDFKIDRTSVEFILTLNAIKWLTLEL